jgi:hypothetical protein
VHFLPRADARGKVRNASLVYFCFHMGIQGNAHMAARPITEDKKRAMASTAPPQLPPETPEPDPENLPPEARDDDGGAKPQDPQQRARARPDGGVCGKPRGPPPGVDDASDRDRDAYSVATFCARHSISVPLFYKLKAQGLGPVTFYAGVRQLISREAAAKWRRKREKEQAAKEAVATS